MASSAPAAALTEAHRTAQARNAAATAILASRAWSTIDSQDLTRTVPLWLRLMLPIIRVRRQISAQLAIRYVIQFREVELGERGGLPAVDLAKLFDLNTEQVTRSLMVTGPVALQRRLDAAGDLAVVRPEQVQIAMEDSAASSAAAAVRHTQNAGRDTIREAVRADERALGFARVTKPNPCFFCAMLASRGPVYTKETGDFQAHDSCGCHIEPVYSREASWPGRAREFQDLWSSSTTGQSGRNAIKAFRRAYEGRS